MADFTKQHVQNLFAQLKLLNVDYFTIEFEGSGDDGQIDLIEFYNNNDDKIQIPEDTITWAYRDYTADDGSTKEEQVTLHKAVEDLGYQMLDESGHDWYNNDGGYGEINIMLENHVGKPSVNMDIKIRYTDEDQYEYENESFTMFAEEGKHKKTDSRQIMDNFIEKYAIEKIPQQELINEDK